MNDWITLESKARPIIKSGDGIKLYTAIAGQYPIERDDIDCFGDEKIFNRSVMEAKRYKILPHLFFPDAEITIWTDANIFLNIDPSEAVDRFLGDNDMAIFRHPYRNHLFQEYKTLQTDKRFNSKWMQAQLKEQVEFYQSQGYREFGLWECNFIIRRNNEKVNRLMDAWWSEICRWQWRDQISFPYVLWKYGQDIKLKTIDEGNIRGHKLFKYIDHYER